MLTRTSAVFLAGLALAGCQSTKEIVKEDDFICRSYGLEVGTPAYIDCREAQQADRTARYQADQQRRAFESAARSAQQAVEQAAAQKERERKARQRCSFTPPDKDGWSKRVCVDG